MNMLESINNQLKEITDKTGEKKQLINNRIYYIIY